MTSAEGSARAGAPPADDPRRARLLAILGTSADILTLATQLLQMCREDLAELIHADNEVKTWARREQLRRECEALFEEVDDEEISPDEREALRAICATAADLTPVTIARTIAEALDAALGSRLLPMFLNRSVTLGENDPIPTPHPDWRTLTPSPNSDPWALDGRLDALPHLRLAGDWARLVRVTLDGDWRTWHAFPQLAPGDRLGCALPNDHFDEFTFTRSNEHGRPVFGDLRVALPEGEQQRRCLALLDRAAAEGCRIVVFPELSVPKPVLEEMARWLDRQRTVELIVAGSRHRKARDGRWHNESQILFRGWRQRRRHRKFRPFAFVDTDGRTRVSRAEDIAVSRPQLRAYLTPSWTVAVLICKDVVQEPAPRMLGDLRANLVMVPALSFKLDAFRAAAGDIASWGQGIALIANAGFGPRPRSPRVGLVVAVPSQQASVHEVVPPARSLAITTIGDYEKNSVIEWVTVEPGSEA